jgi:hypothetical protein
MSRNRLLMLISILLVATVASAKNNNGRPRCETTYSVVQEDKLGNVQQGLSNPKNLKWATKDLEKKYPDVCYAAPDPSVKTVFLLPKRFAEVRNPDIPSAGRRGLSWEPRQWC